jgi:acetoacetyl-CoA reductase
MAKQLAQVTGGMGGLGEAISVKLYDAGYTVVVTHSPINAGAETWLTRMAADGRQFHAYAVDVGDYDSCQQCAQQIKNEIGPLDILINNAGITRDASFKKLDKINWDAVIRTNLDSVFNMTKPLCDSMVERGWGRISMCRRSSPPRVASARRTTRPPKPACMASRNRWRSKWRRKA